MNSPIHVAFISAVLQCLAANGGTMKIIDPIALGMLLVLMAAAQPKAHRFELRAE